MRAGVLLVWVTGWLSAATLALSWPKGETLSRYLDEHNLSALKHQISAEDVKYISEIQADEIYYELWDHGELVQVLIPLGEAMQIHIRRAEQASYRFDIIPMVTQEIRDAVSLVIVDRYDRMIAQRTHYPRLSYRLKELYKNEIDPGQMQPGDRLAFIYRQKRYLGRPVGEPKISAALLQTGGKEHFVFVDRQGEMHRGIRRTETYIETQKRPFTYTTVRKVKSKIFRMPLDHPRITSRFSLRRWHPILKKYRPHFGVDFGAKRGTPLKAVNDGKVIYAGWMRGYGKVVKIDHGGGFVSLYAHQSTILVKRHQYVKRGQTIGKVGSTGRSTGPHLHFGLYRNGKPVDPLKYIAHRGTGQTRTVTEKHTIMKTYPVTRKRSVPIPGALQAKKELEVLIRQETRENYHWHTDTKNKIYRNDILDHTDTRQEGTHG